MKRLLVGVCVILFVLVAFIALPERAQAQGRVGAFADSMFWFEQQNQAAALLDLKAGTMDIYNFQLRTAADIAAAKADPDLYTIDSGGSLNDIYVNPIAVNQTLAAGKANPFAKQPVREALNYLINREFIVRQIAQGQSPMYTMNERTNPEYARDPVFYADMERTHAFNPALARKMIFDALNADPDYSFVNNKWMFKGSPVVLGFVIRTEDVRRNIGDFIATTLESYGFSVDRIYRTAGGARAIVYLGPANTGAWHLYTEGWAATFLNAWQDGNPFFFYGGGSGDTVEGLRGCKTQALKPDPALCDAANKLYDAKYSSVDERKAVYKTAVQASLKDAGRVFVTNGATFAISKRVTGFVYDLSGGPWAFLTPRTARFAAAGGNLQMGQRINFNSPWNPWRGFSWLYDGLQQNAMFDHQIYFQPHTGVYMPIRSTFDVTTAGPSGTMPVPSTAKTWDPATKGFKPVAAGISATSKVVYDFTFGKWQDGSTFDMTDVLYDYALMYRRANTTAGDVYAEDSNAASSGQILTTSVLKGIEELAGGTKLAVYLDYWHPDASNIAAVGTSGGEYTVGAMVPWTAGELAVATVLNNGPCSIDEVTADLKAKVALDLTKGPCLSAMTGNISAMLASRHRPPGFDSTRLPDNAVDAKWAALWAFRNTTGHFLASDGPFYLSNVDTVAIQTRMTRWVDYPFPADRFDSLLVPKVPEISFGIAPTVLAGRPTTFTLTSSIAGVAYDKISMTWLLVDPATGDVLFQGAPTKVSNGEYAVTLTPAQTQSLKPGAYELRTITVGDEAALPVFATQAFIAIPDVDTLLAEQNAKITTLTNELDKQAAQNAATTASLRSDLSSAQTIALVGVGVGVVGVVAGLSGIILARRKGKPPEGGGESGTETHPEEI